VQTHAWFEAAIPAFGWLALDPTNQQEVGVRHVKIGHGRDYDDVQPLRGVFAGSASPHVEPHVEIRRVRGHTPIGYERHTRLPSDLLQAGMQAQQQQQ
jgi:transglutaminase-like putative cysteine protease